MPDLAVDSGLIGVLGDCMYVLVSLALFARRQLCRSVHKAFLHCQLLCMLCRSWCVGVI
jgi:hypothetical protein